MVNALLNLAIQTDFTVLVAWLVLALLGLKWRLFRTIRQGVQQTAQICCGGGSCLAVVAGDAAAGRRAYSPGEQ